MGHNSVISGHPKSTGIQRVDGLSTGPPDLRVSQLGIRAQVNDYLGARVGVSTSVFGYWLVIAEYREFGVQNTWISEYGCRTQHCVH